MKVSLILYQLDVTLLFRELSFTSRLELKLAEIPITCPDFWINEDECTEDLLRHVFRSATDEEIPLFQERVQCLREAGRVLLEVSKSDFHTIIFILIPRLLHFMHLLQPY